MREATQGAKVVYRGCPPAGLGVAHPLAIPADIIASASQIRPEYRPQKIGGPVSSPIPEMIYPALSELLGVSGNSRGFRATVNPAQPDLSSVLG